MFISTNILHQTIAIFPVQLLLFVQGIGLGWLTTTINTLTQENADVTATIEECSWIVSTYFVGWIIAPIFAATLTDTVGRKTTLILCATNIFVSWIIVAFTRTVPMLYVARLAQGAAGGIVNVANAIYIGETSSSDMRGIFTSTCVIFMYVGLLTAYASTTFFTYTTMANTNLVIAGLALLSFVLLEEPAQYLIAKGKYEKAEKNFVWLRGGDEKAKREFEEIKRYVLAQKSKLTIKSLFADRTNRKTFGLVFWVNALAYCTGFEAVNAGVSVILTAAGSSASDQLTILYGFMQLPGVFLSPFFAERYGRRTLMLTAAAASTVIHAVTVALYSVHQNVVPLPHFAWLVLTTATAYAIIFGAILLPVTSTIKGELLPQNAKVKCGCLTSVGCAAVCFVQTKVFFILAQKYGFEANFLLYSICSLIMVGYVYFALPETRGMSLVDIQKSFDNKVKVESG